MSLTGTVIPLEPKPRAKCRKWELRVNLPKRGGRYPKRTKRVHGTWTEANAALRGLIAECEGPRVDGSTTFAEYADAWHARRAASGRLAARTLQGEVPRLSAAKAVLGEKRMDAVTTADIEDLYAALSGGGAPSGRPWSPKSVECMHKTLSALFRDAARDAVIASAPTSGAKRPKVPKAVRNVPTGGEVDSLARSMDPSDPHHMAVLLCLMCGLRRSEAVALEWRDYDGARILVRRASEEDGEPKPTKTMRPREVPVPDVLRKEMDRLRGGPSERVTSVPIRPKVLTRWWSRHRSEFGMDGVRLHDLRHAYLTRLAEAGVHPRVMMELAGHDSMDVCMEIYTHVNDAAKYDAVRAAFGRDS